MLSCQVTKECRR